MGHGLAWFITMKKNLEIFIKNNGKPFKGLIEYIGRYFKIIFRDKKLTK